MAPTKRSILAPTFVFAVTLALFLAGSMQRDLWRTDEHRYVEVAREMTLPGASWWVPHLNGAVYTHKPPGFFWAAASLQHFLGVEVGLAARIVSALAGALTVALVFALGRRFYGVKEGLAAAATLASSEMFLSLAERANLDALLTAFVTAAIYAIWRAEDSDLVAAPRWRLAAGVMTGLGILVKGPVALAVCGSVLVGWRLLSLPRAGSRWSQWVPSSILALALPCAWLLAATHEAGIPYAVDLVLGHGVAHPLGAVSKVRPFWYYLLSLPGSLAPWSLLLPAVLLLAIRRERRGDAFALAWWLAPFALLSLFPAKRHLYLLPILPAVALLVGRWTGWIASAQTAEAARRGLGRLSALSCGVLGTVGLATGVLLVAASISILVGEELALPARLGELRAVVAASSVFVLVVALIAGCGLAASAGSLLLHRTGPAARRALFAFAFSTSLLLAGVVHPIESEGRSVLAFYRGVAQRIGDAALARYEGTDFAPNVLLARTVVPLVGAASAERLVEDRSDGAPPVWLVAEAPAFERHGRPDGFHEVLRHDPPFGPALLLLGSLTRPAPAAEVGAIGSTRYDLPDAAPRPQ